MTLDEIEFVITDLHSVLSLAEMGNRSARDLLEKISFRVNCAVDLQEPAQVRSKLVSIKEGVRECTKFRGDYRERDLKLLLIRQDITVLNDILKRGVQD